MSEERRATKGCTPAAAVSAFREQLANLKPYEVTGERELAREAEAAGESSPGT